MNLSVSRCRTLAEGADVARLATIGTEGPHIVPIVFAIDGDRIVTAIDHKPKRTRHLERLRNIEADPRVAVLFDRYDDDWSQLWWVRADGRALILEAAADREAVDLLAARYEQYANRRPEGPLVSIDVDRWSGWHASA